MYFHSTTAVFVDPGRTTFTSSTFTKTTLPSSVTSKVVAPAFVVQWADKNAIITSLLASQSANPGGDPGDEDTPQPGPLTAGAIAGIVIGITLFFFIVGGLIWWRMVKRKKWRRFGSNAGIDDGTLYGKPELDGSAVSPRVLPQEMPANTVAQKVEEEPPVELPGTSVGNGNTQSPVELAAVGTPVIEHPSPRRDFALTNSHPGDWSILK